ncbi:MAG: ribonuclease H family protein [Bacteroidales bacterium]|nr:ribonuclease H family protein [Bacteroidales bacterium]MDZ4205360.1 ribonuclease H family protein [Bacteroidales bacterium]
MAQKKKFYVVWRGQNPGIYERWADCEKQVKGFTGAIYAGFGSRGEAEQAFASDPAIYLQKKAERAPRGYTGYLADAPITNSLCVDAACCGNPGVMEYRGVFTDTGTIIFKLGPFQQATNNIGEFLAIVHALAWLKKKKLELPVYSDSENAILWVRNRRINTKLLPNDKNQDVFDLIERAVNWLKTNHYSNKVLKWKTALWGEIPADFGRK